MAAQSHSTVRPPHPLPMHVYVDVTGRWAATQEPGLLLEWRRNRTGRWEALVVWASGGGMTPASCRVGWVDAAHVRPHTVKASGSSEAGSADVV